MTHFFSPLDGNLQWKNESTSQLGKIRFKASGMRLYVLQHAHQAMKNSGALNCFPVTKENTFPKLPLVLPYRIISYYFLCL